MSDRKRAKPAPPTHMRTPTTPAELPLPAGLITLPTVSLDPHAFPELPVQERYQLVGLLGRGAFANVYTAVDMMTLQRVAIKHVRHAGRSKRAQKVLAEYVMGKLAEHPHVVELYDRMSTPDDTFIVQELCLNGDLYMYMDPAGPGLPLPLAKHYMQQISAAVAHMHSVGIVHNDIKPENILITGHTAKLCDFGLTELAGTPKHGRAAGTGAYMAPELLAAEAAGLSFTIQDAQDVWSMGVVLYAILYADLPWELARAGDEEYDAFVAAGCVRASARPWNALAPDFCAMLACMLSPDPRLRCTMAEVAAFLAHSTHPWFADEPRPSKTTPVAAFLPSVLQTTATSSSATTTSARGGDSSSVADSSDTFNNNHCDFWLGTDSPRCGRKHSADSDGRQRNHDQGGYQSMSCSSDTASATTTNTGHHHHRDSGVSVAGASLSFHQLPVVTVTDVAFFSGALLSGGAQAMEVAV